MLPSTSHTADPQPMHALRAIVTPYGFEYRDRELAAAGRYELDRYMLGQISRPQYDEALHLHTRAALYRAQVLAGAPHAGAA